MFSQTFRDRVAVAFITLSMAVGTVLAVLVIRNAVSPSNSVASVQPGGASDTTVGGGDSGTPTDAAGATPGTPGTPGGTTAGNPGSSTGAPSAGNPSGNRSGGGLRTGGTSTATISNGAPIVAGGIFDETGPVDSSVERDTVRAYFNKINQAGGVNGHQLVLKDCDSAYDTTAMQRCVRQMEDQNVLAIVGWTAPKGEDDGVALLNKDGVPVIGGLGTPNEYRSSLSFPVSAPFIRYGTAIGTHAATDLAMKHPAIVAIGDVPWLAPVQNALTNALHANGAQETDIELVSATQSDYSGTVFNLQHNGCSAGQGHDPSNPNICPDGLISALDPFSYVRLFNAMRSAGWHPKLLGLGTDKGSVQVAYGDELPNAYSLVPFLSPYDHQSNPTVSDYLSTVQNYYPNQADKLDIYTQHSWTSAMVFVQALKGIPTNGISRKSLVDALNSIQNFETGWSKPLSYSAGTHDPNHCFTYMQHDAQQAPSGSWKTKSDWVCYP